MSTGTNRTVSATQRWRQFAPTAFLAILGAVVSAVMFWAAYSWEMRSIRLNFDALADARCKEVSNAFKETARLLDFMDNVFEIAPRVDDPAFTGYLRNVKKLLAEDRFRHPEIDSLIWAPRVPDAERAAYEQAVQAAFDSRYQIGKRDASGNTEPAARRLEYFPIYLRVAAKGDRNDLGEDLSLDPAVWEVMGRSLKTRTPLATAPMKMSSEAGVGLGYRIFQSLYSIDVPGETRDRGQSLTGFLCLDLDVGGLVDKAMMNIKSVGIGFRVCDNTDGNSVILCEHLSRLSSSLAAGNDGINELETNSETEFFGRKITIQCRSSQAFWIGRTIWQPWVVLFGGLAITFLAAGYQLNYVFHTRAVELAVTKRIARMHKEFEQVRHATQEWDANSSHAESTSGELQGTAVAADIGNDDGKQ